MTINNAVFSILCNSNSLEIEKEEFEKLNNNLKKITTEEVRDLISLAVNKIMKDYGLIEYEKTYLENYKEIL